MRQIRTRMCGFGLAIYRTTSAITPENASACVHSAKHVRCTSRHGVRTSQAFWGLERELVAPMEQAFSGKADEQPKESVKLLGGLVPSWTMRQDIDPNVSLSNHAKSSAERRHRAADSHSGAQVAPGGFMSPDETAHALTCGKADQQPNVSVNLGGLVPPWCSMRQGIDPSQSGLSGSSVRLHEIRFEQDFETRFKIPVSYAPGVAFSTPILRRVSKSVFCAEPGLLPPAEHATTGIHSGALVAPINDRLPDENEQALSYGKAEKQPNESVKLLGGLVPSWSLSQDIDPKVSLSNHAKSAAAKRQRFDYHSGAQVAPDFMSPDVTVQASSAHTAPRRH